jgi:hypothetical protein
MTNNKFWTDETRAQVRALAANGLAASEIGSTIGATKAAILTVAYRSGINIIMHTEAELAEMRARARLREKRKRQKWAAKHPTNAISVSVQLGTSKTAPIYRNQLPRLPEMSKNALREMIAQAVRNTAEMAA